ncbi:hypothetical protein CYV19_06245 [Natronobacterium gregoryi SP2]|uniref:Uncharacterized protein n=2 Tax=Natronobacterium gregoryi TaxID=44930 RepID=L9YFE5_NATGS|nr:hypothetical protein C490_02346 [Natronobacterium gregoryi SP2]PLK21029.1 hypothetical protein CYV19_06245 [Natronobacterium gregoryi SP2]
MSITDELNRSNRLLRVPQMTDDTAHHLREALRHLEAARDGDLRKTHDVALEQVSNTVGSVLQEYTEDQ